MRHRRPFAVVLTAAALFFASAATLAGRASAENGPPTEAARSALPTAPGPAVPPEASPPAPAPASSPTEASSPPPSDPDPVVAAIRTKLAAPSLAKSAHADDLAALRAFYAERREPLWITEMGFSFAGQSLLDEINDADAWGLSATAFDLPDASTLPTTEAAQAEAEAALALAVLKYARFARGGRVKPSEVKDIFDQTPPLRDPKIVLAEIAASDAPDAILRALHPKHEQFARLRTALVKARAEEKPNESDIRRLLVNMERWRWMPEELGPLYVWNNVPEFLLRVVKNGAPIHAEKTLVGELRYATLVFSADMETIVFNPKWTVPETIIKEDLLPKLRQRSRWTRSYDTSVLQINKLKVRYDDKPVDPAKVDWRRVDMRRITFIQAPGPTNVLGKIKFIYPNEHAVYMHDTRKRHLFKKPMRAEGHHCIRVAEPDKLAAVLLAEDKGWPEDKVRALYAKSHDEEVKLDRPIPVHTAYFTAEVDADGKVETFADIYKLDEAVGLAVLGKPGAASAVAAAKPPMNKPPLKSKPPVEAAAKPKPAAPVKADAPAQPKPEARQAENEAPARASGSQLIFGN